MVGIIAADKTGIGLLAERTGEHPVVERGSVRFVDRFLAVTGIGSGDGGCDGDDPKVFHGRLG